MNKASQKGGKYDDEIDNKRTQESSSQEMQVLTMEIEQHQDNTDIAIDNESTV